MPSGDVTDDRAKSRAQPRRALWQAGQQPCAPRLGVGGPAPGVGGAGATSGPDVSPQPHPGGAGYRRRRPRGAARAEGAGTPERAPAGWSGRAPALGEGAWARTGAGAIGPCVRGRTNPDLRRGVLGPVLRALMGVPCGPREAGRKWEPSETSTRTHVVRRRRAGAGPLGALPRRGVPAGHFPARPLYGDLLEPRCGGERGGGRAPLCTLSCARSRRGGCASAGLASASLLPPPASEVCAARRRVRSGRAQDSRPRPHGRAPGRPRPGTQAAGPSRSFPAALRALGAARPEAGSRLGRGRSRGKHRELPDWPLAAGDLRRPESERPWLAGTLAAWASRPPPSRACGSELRAGAAVRERGAPSSPSPPRPTASRPPPPCCPCPAAVAEASNATSCEDRAHRAPPAVWASRRKRSRSSRPANLALTLTGALTLAPSAPPLSSSPVPSPGWPVHNFLPPGGRVPPGPGRPPRLACPDARSNVPAARAEPGE